MRNVSKFVKEPCFVKHNESKNVHELTHSKEYSSLEMANSPSFITNGNSAEEMGRDVQFIS